MALVLSEEQRMLKDAAHAFIQEKSPVNAFRKLRDDQDEDGFDRALWKEMAEMGWAGILVPEEYGGLGFGFMGLGTVLEEAGRMLMASPLISTVVLAGTAVQTGGNEAQRKDVLTAIATGERLLAFAFEEKPHHNPNLVETSATASGDGYKITGKKVFVLDGHVADQLIVSARTSGDAGDRDGITLFLVDADAAGLVCTRTIMVDNRNAANIELSDVEVGADAVLGEIGGGADILEAALDAGRIALSAEMMGSSLQAFEVTLQYLKDREQFGVPIGSFQALKHRAAEMFCELELSKSVVLDALSALDERRNDIPMMASLAKSRLNDTFHLVGSEGVQMHGGIGMTDEHDIGFYLKRSRVAGQTFGNSAFHRSRYADQDGF